MLTPWYPTGPYIGRDTWGEDDDSGYDWQFGDYGCEEDYDDYVDSDEEYFEHSVQ